MRASTTAPPPVAIILLCQRDIFRKDDVRTAQAGGRTSRPGGSAIKGALTEHFESIWTEGAVVWAEETRPGSGSGAVVRHTTM